MGRKEWECNVWEDVSHRLLYFRCYLHSSIQQYLLEKLMKQRIHCICISVSLYSGVDKSKYIVLPMVLNFFIILFLFMKNCWQTCSCPTNTNSTGLVGKARFHLDHKGDQLGLIMLIGTLLYISSLPQMHAGMNLCCKPQTWLKGPMRLDLGKQLAWSGLSKRNCKTDCS